MSCFFCCHRYLTFALVPERCGGTDDNDDDDDDADENA